MVDGSFSGAEFRLLLLIAYHKVDEPFFEFVHDVNGFP